MTVSQRPGLGAKNDTAKPGSPGSRATGVRATAPFLVRRWLPVAVILLLMAIAIQQGWYRYLTLESLVAHEKMLRAFIDANRFGALAIYAALYVVVVALSLPGGLILTLAGGFLFGWFFGGLITVVAATAGATLVFVIARSSIGETLAERAGPRLAALREGFQSDAMSYLLFLRLVPVFPFWLVNIAPALLGVSLRTYLVGTFIGIIPGTFAFAFVGAGLDSVISAQRESFETCTANATAKGLDPATVCHLGLDASALVTPQLLAALVALGVLALVPIAAKKVLGRRSAG